MPVNRLELSPWVHSLSFCVTGAYYRARRQGNDILRKREWVRETDRRVFDEENIESKHEDSMCP